MASDTGSGQKYPVLSAVGGIVAAICFFLPWIGCPTGDLSGAELGGLLWLVLLSALGLVGLYFHFNTRGELSRARLPIGVLAILGLATMIIQWLSFRASEYAGMFRLRFGSVASLLGFGLVLYGLSHFPKKEEDEQRVPEHTGPPAQEQLP